jgi:hypothetical protein
MLQRSISAWKANAIACLAIAQAHRLGPRLQRLDERQHAVIRG